MAPPRGLDWGGAGPPIDEVIWENHVNHHPLQWAGWGDLRAETGPSSTH
jgi:hypothetical protein